MSPIDAAKLCQLSYLPPSIFTERVAAMGHNPIQSIQTSSGINAYTAKMEGLTILAIRGSDTEIDWQHNFNVGGHNYLGTSCHEGFSKLTQELLAIIKKRDVQFVTGHSLGGAMAELISTALQIPGAAFGSPGVRRCWRAPIDVPRGFRRFVLDGDVVGRLPLTFVSDADTLVYVKGQWWPYPTKGYKGKVCNLLKGKEAVFKHHAIQKYVRALV